MSRPPVIGSADWADRPFRAVVLGGSAGGTAALLTLLEPLEKDFPLPLIVVSHLHKSDHGAFCAHLASATPLAVKEAGDKEPLLPGHLYTAPADYHLLVERGGALALSVDPKVHWARPSIDVLFESAARAYAEDLVAVILSGANDDGAAGLRLIAAYGGLCLAQDPATADSPFMPQAGIHLANIKLVLPPDAIGQVLAAMGRANLADRAREGGGER
ncbi:MAG: chemotaxis protein CheB [Deltaproteobacteria bacterium]|nr:chemotaxis protein CheB [Deltaproteobacteria bacterium]